MDCGHGWGGAESPPFDGCFDLVTVAQAAHWLDLPRSYDALTPITHEQTVIAIWGYAYSTVDPRVDACVAQRLVPRIEPFWAEGNRVVIEKYAPIPFPFVEIAWPRFAPRHAWTLQAYMNYLRTWSAVKLFERTHGWDPVTELEASLGEFWPGGDSKLVGFELVGRIGRRG